MKKFKPNLEYFENSISKLKTYFTLKKFDFAPIEVTSNSPCIYVSPKTETSQASSDNKRKQDDLYKSILNNSSEEDMNYISKEQGKNWFKKIIDRFRKFR